MLKTTGSSVASAFRVDDDEVVGGGGAAGAESGESILKRKLGSIVLSTRRTRKTTKQIELLNSGPRDNLWLGLGGQECLRHDLRRVFGLHRYFGINDYPMDLAF